MFLPSFTLRPWLIPAGGFVGIGFPEDLAVAVEQRFQRTGEPRNSTVELNGGAVGGAASTTWKT